MNHEPQAHVDERYPHSETTSRIIAAGQEVHHHLGPGFRELFYQRALALEFPAQELEFSREVWIPLHYRGKRIGRTRVDFLVEQVLVEIKAKGEIEPVDVIQTLSYLKAAGSQVGLLLNFGAKALQIKRVINTKNR
jgi:GxxExxY protein